MGAPARPVFRNPAAATIDGPQPGLMSACWAAASIVQPAAAWLLQALSVAAACACGLALLFNLPPAAQVPCQPPVTCSQQQPVP